MAGKARAAIIFNDDEQFDRAGLIRLAVWGAAAVIALGTAVWAGTSELGGRRASAPAVAEAPSSVDLAASVAQSMTQLEQRAVDADRDMRQMSDALRILMADRDRMALRLGMIERNLGDLTGSVTRERFAATEAKTPFEPKPPVEIKAPTEAKAPPEAKAAADVKPPAELKAPTEAKVGSAAKPAATEAAASVPASPPQAGESAEAAAAKAAAKAQSVAALAPAVAAKPGAIPPAAAAAATAPAASPAAPAQAPAASPAAAGTPAAPQTQTPPAAPAHMPVASAASEMAKPDPTEASVAAVPVPPAAAPAASETPHTAAAAPSASAEPTNPPPAAPPSGGNAASVADFGVDLGPALNLDRLRTRWTSLKTVYGTLFEGLRPVVAIRETNKSRPLEMHLIVGPFPTAVAATKFCAAIVRTQYSCQPATFDGQRLAMR